MKYYIVQGKERNDSADNFFTYHYSGDFTFNELKRKAHLEYCDNAGYELSLIHISEPTRPY